MPFTNVVAATSGHSNTGNDPHHYQAQTVQSYSPGGANLDACVTHIVA